MKNLNDTSEHTFHIPVMGLAFTIDSPIKVAKFGISSVISIVEDNLVEIMRKHYAPFIGKPYKPITTQEPNFREQRITDYLNLMNTIIQQQFQKLKSEAFEIGSDIVKYFEMMPTESKLRKMYQEMMQSGDKEEKVRQEDYLRTQIVAGSIDVNIMTKIDRNHHDKDGNIIPDGSDGVTALRGYAKSNLTNSAVVFSAGMNPRLFSYLESLHAFDPDANGKFKKKIIVKVSDYRSALIQGKFLAKKGLWVSEFRIESGLNCGGHAFATDGYLLGSILEEFKNKREELIKSIFDIYKVAIKQKVGFDFMQLPEIKVTAQGGIGTHEEDTLLRTHYQLSGTGWGTPFLLVPEATTVDTHTLNLLSAAREDDVVLSNRSPLGVRFYYLKGTTADLERQQRIAKGKPGSPCTEKHLCFNTEFTKEPICTASFQYQKHKLAEISNLQLPEKELERQQEEVLAKECLCIGLSNTAPLSYSETFLKNYTAVNVCPGPNIVNFSAIVSLQTMIDHIYGRKNIIDNKNRPHVFIAELRLYLAYLKEQLAKGDFGDSKRKAYYRSFIGNMLDGVRYYQTLQEDKITNQIAFKEGLEVVGKELIAIKLDCGIE